MAGLTDVLAFRLAEARRRTQELTAPLDPEQLNRQYSPILSPVVWDLGHIANFEELWLVSQLGGQPPMDPELSDMYDAIENPRRGRAELPILRGEDCRRYMDAVRERALGALERLDPGAEDPLLADGFVAEMVIAHEHQHGETICQLLQMVDGYRPVRREEPAPEGSEGPEMVLVEPDSDPRLGAGPAGFAYDNERPRHRVGVEPFWIDRVPVTNEAFAAFVADTGAEPPLYWEPDGEGWWLTTTFGDVRAVDPRRCVVHVDALQAEAYAAWADKRLPTEAEWELAAEGADAEAANLGQLAFETAPAGAYADGASRCGAHQMLGDVWEWTASEFEPYPGFAPFPYPEYSAAHFGKGYRVLRGGSWATHQEVARTSFRNWDLAERRQIFAGIRCARDA